MGKKKRDKLEDLGQINLELLSQVGGELERLRALLGGLELVSQPPLRAKGAGEIHEVATLLRDKTKELARSLRKEQKLAEKLGAEGAPQPAKPQKAAAAAKKAVPPAPKTVPAKAKKLKA